MYNYALGMAQLVHIERYALLYKIRLDNRSKWCYFPVMRKRLLALIKVDLMGHSLNSLANLIGMQQSTLYRIVHKQSGGRLSSWEKIEKYYNK
jgi:AraC-like DNA-binding protein